MAQTTPSRRALVDLPVNTLGTPLSTTTVGKASMAQKRQIQDVEEPEFAQSKARVRLSPVRPQSASKGDAPSGQVSHAFPILSGKLTYLLQQTQPALSGAMSVYPSGPPIQVDDTMEEQAEEMGEGDSQTSYKDSAVSSVVDFDPDDTMVSQQTAATEVTQPLRSRISQVKHQCPRVSHDSC